MRLLLVNDDGYNAFGIRALAEGLSKAHHVTVVAPEHERSACSHSITIGRSIAFRSIDMGQGTYDVYAVDGTPADCTRFGLHGLDRTYDLVLSGINHGWNIGYDTLYSGTYAAAREAALFGLKAIALSASLRKPDGIEPYSGMVQWFNRFLEQPEDPFEGQTYNLININFPVTGPYERAIFCRLAPIHYDHRFWVNGGFFESDISLHDDASGPDTDYATLLESAISITRECIGHE